MFIEWLKTDFLEGINAIFGVVMLVLAFRFVLDLPPACGIVGGSMLAIALMQ